MIPGLHRRIFYVAFRRNNTDVSGVATVPALTAPEGLVTASVSPGRLHQWVVLATPVTLPSYHGQQLCLFAFI